MDTKRLQELVASCHDRHFTSTTLKERLRDLSQEVNEIIHYRDQANLKEEIGDAGWSLLQLCNEQGFDFTECIQDTINKLDGRVINKKVALIGISANPITNAHLTLGLEISALTDVDEVWYYLAGKHPWGKKMMEPHHRLEMVRRAVAGYPKLKACDFEIVHCNDLLKDEKETAPILEKYFLPMHKEYDFRWVMGSDAAQLFHKWNGSQWMAKALNFYIVHRLGYEFDKANSLLADEQHIYFRDNVVTSNISSTLVRERGMTHDEEKLVALVPDVVRRYLIENDLLNPDNLKKEW